MSKAEQRTAIQIAIKRLVVKFAPPKPPTPEVSGHTYFIGLCLGKASNFYDIGRYYRLCTQHKGRGVKVDGHLCNKISFLTPALMHGELVELRGLWIDYDRLGTRYSKCGPAPDFLLEEVNVSGSSDASSPSSTPLPVSSPSSNPVLSSPLRMDTPVNTVVNRKRKHSTSNLQPPTTSKRTKYFDLTTPGDQRVSTCHPGPAHTHHTPDLQYIKTVIDLTVADVGHDLQRARALRRVEAQKRLASMVYGGSMDITESD